MAGPNEEAWALPRKRDRFGLRTNRIHSASLMSDIADGLDRMAQARETIAARAYVDDVLRCPYWGLRVLAIRVLAEWGGRRNKAWLMERAGRRTSHQCRPSDQDMRWHDLETMTARNALRPLLTKADGPWLLDAWLEDEGWYFDRLAACLMLIPDNILASRLEEDMASHDAARRMGALRIAGARRDLHVATIVVRSLAKDAHPEVRRFAEVLLRGFMATGQGEGAGGAGTK